MTLLIRLILFAVIATIGVCLVAYLFTRQRRYLNFAGSTFRFAVLFLLALSLLLILERAITAI